MKPPRGPLPPAPTPALPAARERGALSIAPRVLTRLSEHACVEALDSVGLSQPADAHRPRARLTTRGRRHGIQLRLALPYPVPIGKTSTQVAQYVRARLQALTPVADPRVTVEVDQLLPQLTQEQP
ncbi:hypothetical protein [Streptacidiphilus cavernicola]|uniref:Asp23/Gls24 family envelope stress response protein n=1 Tax=Streptacidiphilus cavernicola TaxID=3342716 RepID=A0ABV6VZD2_9ACTN